MKVQLTNALWGKAYNYQNDIRRGNLVLDGKVIVEAYEEATEIKRGLVFKSLRSFDPYDFPLEKKTSIGDDLYFDTDSFEVIDESQYFAEIEKEIPPKAPDQFLGESSDSKCHCETSCKCHCNEERDICRELVLSLAAKIEDCYLGKIDEQCTYLEPGVKSLLNNVLQFKRDEDYRKMDVFDRMKVLMKQCEEDSKKCRTSYEVDAIERMTFRKILEELADFGLFTIVEAEAIQPVPVDEGQEYPSFNNRVIGAVVEKFRYQDHSEEQ